MKKKLLPLLISSVCMSTVVAQETQNTASNDAGKNEQSLDTVDVFIDKDNLFGRTEGYSATRTVAVGRVNAALNETAQSVSVVTRQQIEDQRPETISQALEYSTGAVTDLAGPATRYDYIGLRGFTDNATENTMIDGLRLASNANTFSQMQYDPYFIERIDMIKGSVSSDFGRSVPGGIVSATTKTPLHDQPFHEISLSVGNNNQREFGFDFTNTLDKQGKVAYRLTGLAKQYDSLQEGHETKRYTLAPSLSWDIAPATNLLLQAYVQKDPEGGYHSGLPAEGTIKPYNGIPGGFKFPRNFSDSDPTDKFDRDQKSIGYQFTHKLDEDITFQSKFRLAKTKLDSTQTYNLSGWNSSLPPLVPTAPNGLLLRIAGNTVEESSSLVLDNNVQFNTFSGDIEHQIVVGVDYQKVTSEVDQKRGLADTSIYFNPVNPVYGNGNYNFLQFMGDEQSLKQLGFYINDNVRIQNWHFKVGARYDKSEVELTNRYSNMPALGSFTNPADRKRKENQLSGRLSALYAFENGLSPYISYSTGFNPSLRESPKGEILKATKSRQVEVGLKYQPEGTNNFYSIALYDIEQKNTANRVINDNTYTPSGTRTSKGLELEARTYINDDWFVQGALSVNRPKIKATSGVDAALNGNTPSQAPKWNASVWTNYKFNDQFDMSLGIRHVGEQWADSANTTKVPNYTVVDLGARWKPAALKGAQVSLSVGNLFDKQYVTSCYNDVSYCYYGAERNIKATFSYQW